MLGFTECLRATVLSLAFPSKLLLLASSSSSYSSSCFSPLTVGCACKHARSYACLHSAKPLSHTCKHRIHMHTPWLLLGRLGKATYFWAPEGGGNDADVYLLEQREGMTSGSSVNLIPASGQVRIPGAFRIHTPHSCRLKNVVNRVSSTLIKGFCFKQIWDYTAMSQSLHINKAYLYLTHAQNFIWLTMQN